jgi:hypothetical protein
MNHNINFETIDKEIKKRVQAVESDIPGDLEKTFMKELSRLSMASGPPARRRRSLLFMGALATAASFLLAAFLLVSTLFHKTPTPNSVEEDEVFIASASVEGMPANTYIINSKDPDMTIVWIEKAPVIAKLNNK